MSYPSTLFSPDVQAGEWFLVCITLSPRVFGLPPPGSHPMIHCVGVRTHPYHPRREYCRNSLRATKGRDLAALSPARVNLDDTYMRPFGIRVFGCRFFARYRTRSDPETLGRENPVHVLVIYGSEDQFLKDGQLLPENQGSPASSEGSVNPVGRRLGYAQRSCSYRILFRNCAKVYIGFCPLVRVSKNGIDNWRVLHVWSSRQFHEFRV